MTGGWGLDWGVSWGRATIDVQPSTQHVWVPRMDGGVLSVVDIRGGRTTQGDTAPASAPGVTGFNALQLNEQFGAVDAARWAVAHQVVSGATAFLSGNVTAGAGTLGASGGTSLRLAAKRETYSTAAFTGGRITSTSALTLPRYGYFMARVRIPHGQGLAPAWSMYARNGAALARFTVQSYHAAEPGRVRVTYDRTDNTQTPSTGVAVANAFFEAPTYAPGWHTLALSVEPVNGIDATIGVLIRGYIDGVKSFEYTDTSAVHWASAGGSGTDFWVMQWTGSQVDGAGVGGPDDALGVDDQAGVCTISGTYPGACATTAADGRGIIRVGAPGGTATFGTAASTLEVDWVRVWAFTAYSTAVTGSWSATVTSAWAHSPLLGDTATPDQYATVDVAGLTTAGHYGGVQLRAGAAGVASGILVTVSGTSWRIDVSAGTVYSGVYTPGGTAGTLGVEVTGPATATVVRIYWTPTAGTRSLIGTQTVTTTPEVAAQTGVKLAVWQATTGVALTNLVASSSGVAPPPGTVPAVPVLSGSGGDGRAILSWTPVSGATSYTLRQGANLVATGTFTQYTHTGLTNGVAYGYTVTAANSVGSSAASNAVTVTPQAAGTLQVWRSGMSTESGESAYPAFDAWRGEPTRVAGTWSDISFEAMTALWSLDQGGKYYNWTGDLDLCIGAWWGGSWAQAAAGAYDSYWTQFAQAARTKWHRIQRGTCYVRFAHEWNGNWAGEPWFLYDIADLASWRAAWHRFRVIMSQYFPEGKIVCCTNGDGRTYGAGPIGGVASVLPDPADFDVYASDIYEGHHVTNADVFEQHYAIAQSVGKPFAIGEWGLHLQYGDGANAVNYLNAFNAFGQSGRLLYDVYFNINLSGQDQFSIYPTTSMPVGAEHYRSLTWGAQTP